MSTSTRIRNKVRRLLMTVLTFVGAAAIGTSASAGQSATMTCVVSHYDDSGLVCDKYEFRVSITADGDTGRTGGFGIGVQLASGEMAYWTPAKGFTAFRGGLIEPVEGIVSALPARREYLVFTGSLAELCALSGGQNLDVYAGYGAVPADKEAQLQFLLSRNIKLAADHIRGAYVAYDIHKNPWKVGKVYSQQCVVPVNF